MGLAGLAAAIPLSEDNGWNLKNPDLKLARIRRQKLNESDEIEPEEEEETQEEPVPTNPPAIQDQPSNKVDSKPVDADKDADSKSVAADKDADSKPVDAEEDAVPSDREDKQIPQIPEYPDEEEVATVDEIEDQPELVRGPGTDSIYFPNSVDPNETTPQRQFVYHPYYGYIPAPETNDKKTYVYNRYYGFMPSTTKVTTNKAEDKNEIEYLYDPYYGYLPVSKTNDDREKYVYHSYYGFIPVSQLKENGLDVSTGRQYVYDPYYGYIPAKVEDEKVDAKTKDVQDDVVDALTKEVKTRIFNEVDVKTKDVQDIDVKTKDVQDIDVKTKDVQDIDAKTKDVQDVDAMTKEVKVEREKFYFHPYYGYLPVKSKSDNQTSKDVERKKIRFYYDPYYGYVPIRERVQSDNETKTETEDRKFYYDPLYGYVPVKSKKSDNETDNETNLVKQQQFYYDPLFGYIPVREKSDNETSEEFYLDPVKGYVAIKQKSDNETDTEKDDAQLYVYDPFYGFVSDSDIRLDQKRMPVSYNPFGSTYYPFRRNSIPYVSQFNRLNPYQHSVFNQVCKLFRIILIKTPLSIISVDLITIIIYPLHNRLNTINTLVLWCNVIDLMAVKPVTSLTIVLKLKKNFQGFVAKKLQTSNPEVRALNVDDDELEAKVLEAVEDGEVAKDEIANQDSARRKRSSVNPPLLNSQVYNYPGSPYVIYPAAQAPANPIVKSSQELPVGLFYHPEYYYHLGLPTVKASRQFLSSPIQPTYFNQPTYNIPYVAPGQAVRSDSEEPITDDRSTTTIDEENVDKNETSQNFPVVAPGAVVVQQPLPETQFPLFPYDPQQDQPAAVQF